VPCGVRGEPGRAWRGFSRREEAERRAKRDELEFVPSFHPDLVTGVATYALEFCKKRRTLEVLYVPIGPGIGHLRLHPARDC